MYNKIKCAIQYAIQYRVFLGNPLLTASENGGGKQSRDTRFTTVLLLRPRDRGNRSFTNVLGTKHARPAAEQNKTK